MPPKAKSKAKPKAKPRAKPKAKRSITQTNKQSVNVNVTIGKAPRAKSSNQASKPPPPPFNFSHHLRYMQSLPTQVQRVNPDTIIQGRIEKTQQYATNLADLSNLVSDAVKKERSDHYTLYDELDNNTESIADELTQETLERQAAASEHSRTLSQVVRDMDTKSDSSFISSKGTTLKRIAREFEHLHKDVPFHSGTPLAQFSTDLERKLLQQKDIIREEPKEKSSSSSGKSRTTAATTIATSAPSLAQSRTTIAMNKPRNVIGQFVRKINF